MRRRTHAVLLAAPLVAATLACGIGGTDTEGPGADSADGGKKHAIVLEVTGPASADVTYGTGADQSQEQGAALPWTKQISMDNVPIAITIVAQSKGVAGDITCKITVDGKVKKENKSTGQYAVVTCSA